MTVDLEGLNNPLLLQVAERTCSKLAEIERTRKAIYLGTEEETDSPERLDMYRTRQAADALSHGAGMAAAPIFEGVRPTIKKLGHEALIGQSNDLLSIEYLEFGIYAARSVGRIEHTDGFTFGTGFLVGQNLAMTNQHVLPTPEEARDHFFELGAEANRVGNRTPTKICAFDPERFFWSDEALDIALVAVTDEDPDFIRLANFGWHALIEQQGKIKKGDPVAIIQHPLGRNKALAVHNNHFLHIENGGNADAFCWYSGDTQQGSSGSPVFNRNWEVVAVHHMAVPKTNAHQQVLNRSGIPISQEEAHRAPSKIAYVANEGIRTSRIIQGLKAAALPPDHAAIRQQLLALWQSPGAHRRGLRAASKTL